MRRVFTLEKELIPLHIIAADDEALALKLLVSAITEACPNARISAFQKASDVLAFLEQESCDVAFLDIRMRGTDGLTLACRIKQLHPGCNLIFVTGHSGYAIDALSLHASGYILKPVDAEKIRRELADLRYAVTPPADTLLRLNCFGNFEVFTAAGEPVRFSRSKAKELLAYLTYRKGNSCAVRELAATLFEDNVYSSRQMTYLQKIISSMMQTLKECGAEQVITKSYNAISLNEKLVDCDYYRFLRRDSTAIDSYTGEFMAQYSWAEFVAGYLDRLRAEPTEAAP